MLAGGVSTVPRAKRPGGAAEMLLQQPHGFGGIAAKRSIHQISVFARNVASLVVADRAGPPTVQFGSVTQRQRHRAEPLVRARGQERSVKARVAVGPLLAHHRAFTLEVDRCPFEYMIGSDHPALPCDVAVFDRHPQHQTFERAARGGEIFEVVKFRTMRDAIGPDGQPLPDAWRMTRLGRFLRSTSLDELRRLYEGQFATKGHAAE